MEEFHVNIMAVVVATVANFFLGYVWYTVIFGKAWAIEMKIDMSGPKPSGGDMAKGMIFMVIGNFLMAYVFASNSMAWSFVPGVKEMGAAGNILNATVFTWLGFYLPGDLSRVGWEKHSWKLFGINTGYHLVMLLLAAVIIYYM
ncbi:MAG: DUF1761 domain-containing protein [Cyclobacteriaceae bacterium]|nr:DUF1761 domain-containing protein [Cyclobacteriaceae bacterium]